MSLREELVEIVKRNETTPFSPSGQMEALIKALEKAQEKATSSLYQQTHQLLKEVANRTDRRDGSDFNPVSFGRIVQEILATAYQNQ